MKLVLYIFGPDLRRLPLLPDAIVQTVVLGCVFLNYNDSYFKLLKYSSSP